MIASDQLRVASSTKIVFRRSQLTKRLRRGIGGRDTNVLSDFLTHIYSQEWVGLLLFSKKSWDCRFIARSLGLDFCHPIDKVWIIWLDTHREFGIGSRIFMRTMEYRRDECQSFPGTALNSS